MVALTMTAIGAAVLMAVLFVLSAMDAFDARRDVRLLHRLLSDACARCPVCQGRRRYALRAEACGTCLPWHDALTRVGRRYGVAPRID